MKHQLPILFALGTALCWGLYGPTLQHARPGGSPPLGPPDPAGWSPFKPYVGIGLAYLVIAIIGGLVAMKLKGDSFSFSDAQAPALKWGFAAGVLGALGAFCLTSAMSTFIGKPQPQLVMPIVFGGAVTITALHSAISHGSMKPMMAVGILLTAVGIVLVASNTSHGPTHTPTETETTAPAPVAGTAEVGEATARDNEGLET
ncbi:MAG: hypothetical protein CMJ65_04925 [Planctomycetaceae bacterium]|nr:hypothetical protein [Planctomycetaceae bacterium]